MEVIVHYYLQWSLPLTHLLSHIHPIHLSPAHTFNSHFNIILPVKNVSSKRSSSFRFPHQTPLHISLLPHNCHILCPSHLYRLHQPNTNQEKQKALNSSLYSLFPVNSKHLPQYPTLKYPQPMVFLNVMASFKCGTTEQEKL